MEGDGIGPEITAATLEVLRVRPICRCRSSWPRWRGVLSMQCRSVNALMTPRSASAARRCAHGTTLPDAAVAAAKAADGVILGPVSHNEYPPAAQGRPQPVGRAAQRLDLFANIRPARSRAAFRRAAARPSTS